MHLLKLSSWKRPPGESWEADTSQLRSTNTVNRWNPRNMSHTPHSCCLCLHVSRCKCCSPLLCVTGPHDAFLVLVGGATFLIYKVKEFSQMLFLVASSPDLSRVYDQKTRDGQVATEPRTRTAICNPHCVIDHYWVVTMTEDDGC